MRRRSQDDALLTAAVRVGGAFGRRRRAVYFCVVPDDSVVVVVAGTYRFVWGTPKPIRRKWGIVRCVTSRGCTTRTKCQQRPHILRRGKVVCFGYACVFGAKPSPWCHQPTPTGIRVDDSGFASAGQSHERHTFGTPRRLKVFSLLLVLLSGRH